MSSKLPHKALVVLSGGQDSVTCLGLALKRYETVEAISFNYDQRHVIELNCAAALCMHYKVDHKLLSLPFLPDLVTSALTGIGDVGLPHAYKPGLPSSFVPCRNALFLTLAHAHAQEIGSNRVITGVCQTDYSGYPDCRDEFVQRLASALNCGYETEINFITPLMYLGKAETFAMAESVGFLEEVLENSHTCYRGNHTDRHEWGYGCNDCPACELRRKGWETFVDAKEKLGPHAFAHLNLGT